MLMEGLFLFSKCLCSQRQAVDLSFHVFVFPALTLRALLFPVIVASTFFLTSCITVAWFSYGHAYRVFKAFHKVSVLPDGRRRFTEFKKKKKKGKKYTVDNRFQKCKFV